MGIEVATNHHRFTVLSRCVLTVSDFHILIKPCSIESRNDPSPKSEVVHETKFSLKNLLFNTYICLAQLDKHQTSKSVVVSCEFNSHWRQFYFSLQPFKIPPYQFCYKHFRFVLFAKASNIQNKPQTMGGVHDKNICTISVTCVKCQYPLNLVL